jgi:hypothetical protein
MRTVRVEIAVRGLDSAIMCLTHTLKCLLKLEYAGTAEPAATTASDLWAMP